MDASRSQRRTPGAARPGVRIALLALALVSGLLSAPALAQERPTGEPAAAAESRSEGVPPAAGPPAASEAEGRLNLQQRLASDRARLDELASRVAGVKRELEARTERFRKLDAELAALRAARDDPEAPPPAGVDPEELGARIEALEAARAAARDAVDLAIRRRKALDAQAEVLRQDVAFLEEVRAVLAGGTPASPPGAPPAGPASAESAPAEAEPAPAPAPAVVLDHRVTNALRELERRQEAFERLARDARFLDRAIDLNTRDVEASGDLLTLAREEQAQAEQEQRALLQELEALGTAGAPERRRAAVRRSAARAGERSADAAREIAELEARAAKLTRLVEELRAQRVALDKALADAGEAVESARQWVEFLESPWAPHRIVRRVLSAAPRVATVLGILLGVWFLGRLVLRRFARTYVERVRRGSRAEREERAETLHRASLSILNSAMLLLGGLLLLDQLGIDVTVLLGGAAIFGVALAFGAQNLVQDYYFGFMILLENQYRVGNVVRIGNISGVVEDITLRMTVLRDLEGVAHFIPHSQISTVSNMTHYWSRAMLDVGVAYKEDVDRVIGVLTDLTAELRQDPKFGPMVLEDAEILGVDQLADSAVVVRMIVKTVPVQQWAVKRELLRRIKNRFDELGIEIPFPHRSVYHRGFEGNLALRPDGAAQPTASHPGGGEVLPDPPGGTPPPP